jgi:hypothetical protein
VDSTGAALGWSRAEAVGFGAGGGSGGGGGAGGSAGSATLGAADATTGAADAEAPALAATDAAALGLGVFSAPCAWATDATSNAAKIGTKRKVAPRSS